MNEFETLRADVLAATEDVLRADVVHPPGPDFEPLRERLADGSLRVVVFGEFRRGKSTLLNTLVHRDVFPVELGVTTAVVTTLQWGDEDRAVVHRTSRAGPLPPDEIPLEQVREYITEQLNPDNRRGVILVELYAPVDELASGLVVVDTPGLGSVNRLHSAATREYLKRADAVVFVASAVQPPGDAELGYLKVALGHTSRFLTALAMSDLTTDARPVVAEARRRIAEAVGVPAGDLAIFPVSALMQRMAAEEDDAELMAASGFSELATALWTRLAASCASARLKPVTGVLRKLLDQAAAGTATELAGLDNDREQRRIRKELQGEQSRLLELSSESTSWRQQVAKDLAKVAKQARTRLDRDFAAIREMVSLEACRPWIADTSAVPVEQITLAISQAVESAAHLVATAAQDTGRRYSAAGTIHLTVNGSRVTLFSPVVDVPLLPDLKPQSLADAVLSARTGQAKDLGLFSVLFAGIGAIVVPSVGVPALLVTLGRLFDQLTTVVATARDQIAQQQREQQQQRAEILHDALTRAVDLNRQRAQDQIEDLIPVHVRDLTEQIDRWYESGRRLAQQTISQYEENERSTAHSREIRRGVLRRKAATLAELSARIERLENRIDGLGAADDMSTWA